eukprot:6180473-Pleurochrysis_carterae.AAC.8
MAAHNGSCPYRYVLWAFARLSSAQAAGAGPVRANALYVRANAISLRRRAARRRAVDARPWSFPRATLRYITGGCGLLLAQ